ncbi:MAG: penicillin-binding protein activator [Cellvibrio sp.]
MSRLSSFHTIALGALCAALILPLSGCGDSQVKPSTEDPIIAHQASAKALLEKARLSQSPERESLFLEAASVYLKNERFTSASSALSELNYDSLNDRQFAEYSSIKAAVALHEGANLDAFNALTQPRLEQQLTHLDGPLAAQIRELRAKTFYLLGEYEAAVHERFAIENIQQTQPEHKDNTNQLWNSLLNMPIERLEYLSERAQNDTARGWFALATIGKNTQYDLTQQQSMINQWRRQWPSHPAAKDLPDDLNLIKDLIASQPKHIALLLPQSGKLKEAGEAVRDGFYSAYYQAHSNGRSLPQISLFDSENILQSYQSAVAQGADLVIGPLEKEKVAELASQASLPTPILALNYTDDVSAKQQPNFYQFGLAVEDEARQVARRAFADGHRQAMLIIADQEWSERASRAFSKEWETLGGKVVSNNRFRADENFSKLVKDAMLIEESQTRARELESLLGIGIESKPRARADVDMIFLIANPVQARQIKPTFAFHFASKIPVYATSQVYSGEANPKLDRDLNGIRFNTMPWLFDNTSPERLAVKDQSKLAAVYDKLQALGVDAFRVYARLPQLAKVEQMRVYGATGTLRMLPDGRIEREQVWARFRNGVASPQATLTTSESDAR